MATLQGKFQFKKVLSIDAEISQNVNFVSTTFFEDGSTRKLTCSAMYVVPGTADATGHLDYTIEAVEPADGEEYPKTTEVYMDSELGWGAALVGQDVIVVVDFGDTPQEVSDEYANWVSRNTVTVSSENPAATVSYKGETLVAIAGGKSVTLRTNGKRMEDDLKIVALSTGGSCDYECVIPVDELPTENIDTNAVYLCKGAYYKSVNTLSFTDLICVENGVPQSVAEVYPSYGIPVYFYTIPTKTTDAIESSDAAHFYYIEDENDVFAYADGEWIRFNSNWTFGGIITDTSEATDSNTYYAIMGGASGWTKYLAPTGTLEITESGTYDVSEYASVEVTVAGGGGGSTTLPEIGVASDGQITDTWEQIIEAINQGVYKERYAIRNYKTLNLSDGTTVNMEVAAFDTDRKPDETFAAITWISKAVVAKRQMSASTPTDWSTSDLRAWLQENLYSYLPTEVQNAIVTVRKTSYSAIAGAEVHSDDTIWIPSVLEAFNSKQYEAAGWAYTDYFTSDSTRKKYFAGVSSIWLLRTPSSSSYFNVVSATGTKNTAKPTDTNGVVIGFCT